MNLRVVSLGREEVNVESYLNRNTFRQLEVEESVERIISRVREKGDRAVLDYTREFDGVWLKAEDLPVSPEEIDAAYGEVEKEFIAALKVAKLRIEEFHRKQLKESWFMSEDNGTILGQLIRPLEKVGLYAPGGRAVYPSSVLMTAIPAKLAGVKELILCTPPDREGRVHPQLLVAAKETGVSKVFRCGGAQALAALAYGTESIPRVDKIVGPGNIYVATAKKQLYGQVDIDSIAGPSEVVIIADSWANPSWIAADLIAQAEHDPEAAAILITSDKDLAVKVCASLERQLKGFERREIVEQALKEQGIIFLVQDLQQAAEVSNLIAPEHLQLMIKDPWSLLGQIKSAGAVFLGEFSPVAAGDYSAGTNHVLPTGGTARFFSALSVDHFLKKINLASISACGLAQFGQTVMVLARGEGLPGHARAIQIRLKGEKEEEAWQGLEK